jgi:hypothetical protein
MKFFVSAFLVVFLAVFGLPSLGLTAPIVYTANLDGPSEDQPNASPGTGSAMVTYDDVARTLRVQATFEDLLGITTAAHIHGPTASPGTGAAGVMTTTPSFPDFPLGVTAGSFDSTFDLSLTSSFNPAFVTANGGTDEGAEAAFAAALAQGRAYFNIHTTQFPAGEIRGFLAAPPVPASMLFFGTGLAGLAGLRLRRKQLWLTPGQGTKKAGFSDPAFFSATCDQNSA